MPSSLPTANFQRQPVWSSDPSEASLINKFQLAGQVYASSLSARMKTTMMSLALTVAGRLIVGVAVEVVPFVVADAVTVGDAIYQDVRRLCMIRGNKGVAATTGMPPPKSSASPVVSSNCRPMKPAPVMSPSVPMLTVFHAPAVK